ncbi:MAG: thioredoxin domain-containing protein [Polyangiaceae bacterium]|nr:thioredoxin domain-containing protein [Polyangiaceae bacterium]
MKHSNTWLGLSLALSACSQAAPPEDVGESAAPVAAAPTPALPAKPAGGDCDCHGSPGAVPKVEHVDLTRLELARAPSRGRAQAPVTLVVFCDFECPYCHRVQGTLRELESTYGSDLRIVFKQLPLPMHAGARLAAKASMIAADQGKFWELHDLLMKAEKIDRAELDRLAAQAGLNLRLFATAMADPALDTRLDRELEEAAAVGARGTPTFLINGRRFTGAQPAEAFTKLIDEALGAPL